MNYPFKFLPFKHQAQEFELFKDSDARALLWQMRTGKTKVTIDTACYRHGKGDIDGLLVLAPNGVHTNWVIRELPAHGWDRSNIRAHVWRTSQSHELDHRASLEAVCRHRDGLAALAVNSEALANPKTQAAVKAFMKGRRIMLVVDESHDFRTPGSRRSKLVRGLARKCVVRRILTGTVVDNSPLAAFAQFEILHHGALGYTTFEQFKSRYSIWATVRSPGGRDYPVLKDYSNLDELRDKIAQYSSLVRREDCEDLPPLMPVEVTVELTDAQREAYLKLTKEFIIDLENRDEPLTVVEGGARMTKLQQILSGFAIDELGNIHTLIPDDDNPRLNALSDQIAGTAGKLIVWCQFREDLRKVVKRLERDNIKCVEYHGLIRSDSQRQAAIDAFMKDPEVKVFVGQPKAGGAGLNLSAAEAVVWYSHTFDVIVRNQATERATLVGGKSIAVVDLVTPRSVDGYIFDNHNAKRENSQAVAGQGLREKLLAMFKEYSL